MAVFVKDAADPFREWKRKHVPSVCRGPVRNTQTGLRTGDEPAHKDQERSAAGSEQSKAVEGDTLSV